MIRIESLSASFGQFRLEDICLEVPAASSTAILGPSGSGKTLLLETLIGLRRPSHGRVLIDGQDVTRWPPERRGISYLPQDVALFPHLSVRDNILFGAAVRGQGGVGEQDLGRLAELLDIQHLLPRRNVRSLSGGEAQRVALARALLIRPRILVSDESFSSLDAPLRRQLQHDFRRLQRDLQLTVLHVTHDQEEAFLLADQVAVLMQGRVVQVAGTSELYARPNSIRVARFLGISNIWPVVAAQVSGSSLLCQVDGLTLEAALPQPLDSPPTHVGVAASEVELTESTCRCAGANRFSATVVSALHLGHRRLIRLRLDGLPDRHLECSAAPRPREFGPWTEGTRVQVHIDPASVRLFYEPADRVARAGGERHG